ncbi:MAG: orotidine-5'-phosphate decarboxylase [Patescibacteria group bacterium]|nr:orotidine-5'-phosphate decarboxylase [Patescibacteria group bacterium]
MLEKRWNAGARVCLGLDSKWDRIPPHIRTGTPDREAGIFTFNSQIIRATAGSLLCYKPNASAYQARTRRDQVLAQAALHQTIEFIHDYDPDTAVVDDAKRTDIGSSNEGYVEEIFGAFDADAITVNPYFGGEALMPFLMQTDKGIIVLCRTSNPGAKEFQDRTVSITDEEAEKWSLPKGATMPLYQLVAYRFSREWNQNKNVALVVGATYPEELKEVREIVGDNMWLLNPGAGKKQGGNPALVVRNGINSRKRGIIINAGSDTLFASSGEDFAEATAASVKNMESEINAELERIAA